jgi:hypothetical protein
MVAFPRPFSTRTNVLPVHADLRRQRCLRDPGSFPCCSNHLSDLASFSHVAALGAHATRDRRGAARGRALHLDLERGVDGTAPIDGPSKL